MRIIARSISRAFIASLIGHQDQPAVKAALDAWFAEAKAARCSNTADIRRRYATAGIVPAERVVLNIKGNAHRLVVSVDFQKSILWIKWIGTRGD
jgi:mRNA interferase HigB